MNKLIGDSDDPNEGDIHPVSESIIDIMKPLQEQTNIETEELRKANEEFIARMIWGEVCYEANKNIEKDK